MIVVLKKKIILTFACGKQLALCSQTIVLRGSGSMSAETTKWSTWSKPEKWCSRNLFESGSIDLTNWINWIPLVIDISCPTMHYGKFVCFLSTKWLPSVSFKQDIGQCHRLQYKHIIWEYSHTVLFFYVLNMLLQFIGWEIS